MPNKFLCLDMHWNALPVQQFCCFWRNDQLSVLHVRLILINALSCYRVSNISKRSQHMPSAAENRHFLYTYMYAALLVACPRANKGFFPEGWIFLKITSPHPPNRVYLWVSFGSSGTAVAQWLGAVLQIGKSLVRSQLLSLELFIDIKSFRSHHGPRVDSASKRNEYQEHFQGVKAAGA